MRTVHAALDAGLRLLDTAVNYGSKRGRTGYSEALVARALAPWSGDPDDVVVVCKGGNLRTDEQTFVQDASRHQQRRTSAARRGADGRRHRGGREPALTVVARRAARPPAVRGPGHRVPLLEPPWAAAHGPPTSGRSSRSSPRSPASAGSPHTRSRWPGPWIYRRSCCPSRRRADPRRSSTASRRHRYSSPTTSAAGCAPPSRPHRRDDGPAPR
jgi:hypothetical protein